MSKIDRMTRDQSEGLSTLSYSKPVKVIAITAGKGGVGKSNISLNLALALAQLKKSVLLMDADLGLGNLDIMLGMKAKYNLSHVVQGLCSLTEIIIDGPYGIKVIPAPSGMEHMTQLSSTAQAGLIDAFNELTDSFDYMIIDTAAGISETVLSFARSSQELIVIVCDEPTSLTDTYSLMKVMSKRFEWCHFHILANMVATQREGRDLFNKLYSTSENFLDVRLDYLGAIPFDIRVHDAIKKQEPLLIAYPEAEASKMFVQIADVVDDWPYKQALGNTSFFLERLVARKY